MTVKGGRVGVRGGGMGKKGMKEGDVSSSSLLFKDPHIPKG